MIKTLNFVKGAVSTKDLVPVLTNFHFYDGRVQGGNGRITIDAPLDLGGRNITVPAVPFLKAITACDGAPVLNITDAGRLTIKKGSFRSILPLADGLTFPLQTLDDQATATDKTDELIKKLRIIKPFIGDDASRPWSCGCLFADGYIYATNNVVMVRVPWGVPEGVRFNLPSFAVDELLRIGEQPDGFCFERSDTAVTFKYGDRWLRSQLFDTDWPDVGAFFNDEALEPVPEGLRQAVEKILPFCPDSKFPLIILNSEGVSTADGTMTASVGDMELPDGRYRAEPLLAVLSHAISIDLTKYPAAVPFLGAGGLQGVMVGVK
jgi:DNA polymerase III sliding clamp (beta) subunit (PCNA family)